MFPTLARVVYCETDESLDVPVNAIRIKTKAPAGWKWQYKFDPFWPQTDKDFIRNKVYRVKSYLCQENNNVFKMCAEKRCNHKALYARVYIVALGTTVEQLAKNAEGVRKTQPPAWLKSNASEAEITDYHSENQLSFEKQPEIDLSIVKSENSPKTSIQPQLQESPEKPIQGKSLKGPTAPLGPKFQKSPSQRIKSKVQPSPKKRKHVKSYNISSESDCSDNFELTQEIIENKKLKASKVAATGRSRAQQQLKQFEKKDSPKKLLRNPRTVGSGKTVKKLNFDSGKQKAHGYNVKDYKMLMAQKDDQIESQQSQILQLQAKTSQLNDVVNGLVTSKENPHTSSTHVRTSPTRSNNVNSESAQTCQVEQNRIVESGTLMVRPTSSSIRESSSVGREGRKRKAELCSRGYGAIKEGEKRPRKQIWALLAIIDLYYRRSDGAGFEDYKKRYKVTACFIYIGEGVYVHEDEWTLMINLENPIKILEQLCLYAWDDDDFANRQIEPEKVKPSDFIPGRGPVLQLQLEKIRWVISLYKDVMTKLRPEDKKFSAEEVQYYLTKSTCHMTRYARILRKGIISRLTG